SRKPVPSGVVRFTRDARLPAEGRRGELPFPPSGGEWVGEYGRHASKVIELTPPARPPFEFEESRPSASNGAKPSLIAAAGRRKRSVVWATVALIVIASGAYLLFRSMSPSRSEGKVRLAVLPFRNLGPDKSADFLSRSLSDEVITKLNYISALTVRPSAYVQKYANQEIDPGQVASELKVDKLLTGAFVKEGDELRINLQLVDVANNQALWSESLTLKYEKLMTVQDRVAQAFVRRMSVSLTPAEAARLQRGAASNLQAYEYHLQGVDLYHRDDLRAASEMFEKSVGLDPNYPPSWAYLGTIDTTLASLYFGGREFYDK